MNMAAPDNYRYTRPLHASVHERHSARSIEIGFVQAQISHATYKRLGVYPIMAFDAKTTIGGMHLESDFTAEEVEPAIPSLLAGLEAYKQGGQAIVNACQLGVQLRRINWLFLNRVAETDPRIGTIAEMLGMAATEYGTVKPMYDNQELRAPYYVNYPLSENIRLHVAEIGGTTETYKDPPVATLLRVHFASELDPRS
jgi:hypothetical protein